MHVYICVCVCTFVCLYSPWHSLILDLAQPYFNTASSLLTVSARPDFQMRLHSEFWALGLGNINLGRGGTVPSVQTGMHDSFH